MSHSPHHREGELIGRGRSGVVYYTRDASGRDTVRKVFGGDGASKLVMYVFTGAPNPYIWCEEAIRSASLRREILARLVKYWFDDGRVRLPANGGWAWNAEHSAFELRSELVRGRHVPLRHRWNGERDAVEHLTRDVMKPLQQRLIESGFDGLVWQAGLGNPVAGNNFMLETKDGGAPRWVWIDLESGIPAVVPMNPLKLFGFYLPRAARFGRFLFDDVDGVKLAAYLQAHRSEIDLKLGPAAFDKVSADAQALQHHQRVWKQLPRAHRSIGYHLSQRRITPEQAAYYRKHTPLWYARLARQGLGSAARKIGRGVVKVLRKAWEYRWGNLFRSTWLFCFSQKFRTRMAHRYVSRRIGLWELRRCFGRETAQSLRAELRHDEASEYIADFGMHLALKVVIKPLQWTLGPALYAADYHITAGIVVIGGGFISRTAYTLGRLVQAAIQRHRLPWVALFGGLLPMVGNVAYPMQLAYESEKHHGLPSFILYDAFAMIGRRFPIWGGQDTLTEHWFNRLPDVFRRR